MRILAIHGVGHADAQTGWQDQWRLAAQQGLAAWNPAAPAPDLDFLSYDELFEAAPLDTPVVTEALLRVCASGLFYGITDMFRNRAGFSGALEAARWTAGMVAQWVALEDLRSQLRARLEAAVRQHQPDVVLAHSLGSLIAYDCFRRDEVAHPAGAMLQDLTLVTFGSQIGNPAVRAVYGGRVEQLQAARFWWHLYNREDDVFTCPISLPGAGKFRQVDTFFDIPGFPDHDGATYLGHGETRSTVWQDLAATVARGRSVAGMATTAKPAALARPHLQTTRKAAKAAGQQRALLVGIADYPDPASRLEGPVNDVFSVSATLQELGFDPDNIRVVLNDRATAVGIRERLQWLLSDARDGDQLFFFYAGHGAQVPGYGRDAEVDHIDECLVPYDFDWSKGCAITDDEFAALYAQLPYACQFTAVLDCCHAGGMARASGSRARGLTPPDDIRHRMLRWDRDTQMWLPRRRLQQVTADEARTLRRSGDRERWLGNSGSVRRLGRGTSLWLPSDKAYRSAKSANEHYGPYVPILFEACQEDQFAYEYRHGVVSHGAFSYSLCGVLRDAARGATGKPLSFGQLLAETSSRMAAVVPEPQTPQLNCASVWRMQPIPGL